MNIEGSFALSIIDTNLQFKEIENKFPIQPTRIVRKGQLIGKGKNIVAPYDIWSYEISIANCENIFSELSLLIDVILPYSEFIKEAISKYERVVINCYLRSDYGQIGFRLSDEIICKLEKIGLGLDFNILSFGEVDE